MDNQSEASFIGAIAAARHLGITTELLFQYTKQSFAASSGLRALRTSEQLGKTMFSIPELDAFDALLAGEWPSTNPRRRPAIPKAILNHLYAESLNRCARCGSGIGVETAHIRPWAESRSHHHANLIRVCAGCHREHDVQNSLPEEALRAIKQSLIDRTRRSLDALTGSPKTLRGPLRADRCFLGRQRELSELIGALESDYSVIITGAGGIGKTELVVQALLRAQPERPVFWLDADQYRSVTELKALLQTALAKDGAACPEAEIAARLDDIRACVVFDGIERRTLDDIDSLEDFIAKLHLKTAFVQIVVTSQVPLHRFRADWKQKIRKLERDKSSELLTVIAPSDRSFDVQQLQPLLDFCDGHPLTLRLVAALMDHYGGPSAALHAIKAKGTKTIQLPGRQNHSSLTSLDLCLQTAYRALTGDAQQLLWALANSPAGLLTHYFEAGWLELSEPLSSLSELRRWNLVDVVPIQGELGRTQMLSPIRAFAISSGQTDATHFYELTLDHLVQAQGMIVAVLELAYNSDDTPYVVQRFGDEIANFLQTIEIARARSANMPTLLTALSIARSLMRYYFVSGLYEQGANVMNDAARLALRCGQLEKASGLIMQAVGLAQRTSDAAVLSDVADLLGQLEAEIFDGRLAPDILLSKAMLAESNGYAVEAEKFARAAAQAYSSRLEAIPQVNSTLASDSTVASGDTDGHNDLANALVILGSSLLAQQRFEEAGVAYRRSLVEQRGTSIAVNRGQILHQIGNCEASLGRFKDASEFYSQAIEIFHFVGMDEYLSNASGELGYTLLDISHLSKAIEREILVSSLNDLSKHMRRVFDLRRPLKHDQCSMMIRKLFGTISLISLSGKGDLLGQFCASLGNDIVVPLGKQIRNRERQFEDSFPLEKIETALRLGLLVAEGELSIKEHGAVSEVTTIDSMLRIVCNADVWTRETMRVVDWFCALLSSGWEYEGANPERLRNFIDNLNADVIDYLDLTRRKST